MTRTAINDDNTWNIFSNNASHANNNIVANFNTRHDDDKAADPTIIAKINGYCHSQRKMDVRSIDCVLYRSSV